MRELVKNKDVLDCFCYTGGFTVNALAGGAKSILSVDSSADALKLCKENIALNNLPAERHTSLEGDVFHLLRKFRDEARSFDMIILDPPKFAPTSAHAEKATRAYKDINLLAFKLLRPGGMLVTFVVLRWSGCRCFRRSWQDQPSMRASKRRSSNIYHRERIIPSRWHFPEGAYLKGLVCIKG